MFSSLPFCDVEKLKNDEFAQSFGYENFAILESTEKACYSIALKNTETNDKCDVKKLEEELNKNLKGPEYQRCEESINEPMKKIYNNIDSKEFKNKNCNAWMIGINRGGFDKNINQEYERRKNE